MTDNRTDNPKDWADAFIRGYDVRESADKTWQKAKNGQDKPTWRDHAFTAADLQHKTLAPIQYIVPGLIPEGLSMLVGRPKLGKSWLALDIGIAIALPDGTCLGGREPQHGNVLYCALEDNVRRLQARITKLLGGNKQDWPKGLTLTTLWRRLDKGGVADIAEWVKTVAFPRLVILDTLASVKPIRTTSGYTEDYESLTHLHRLANDLGVAILVLHHQRKGEADDPLDTISGTLGLAGCVDTPIILAGSSHGMTLYVRGRDIEEAEHAIAFDKATCRWSIVGDAAEVQRSDTRSKILAVLARAKPNAMGPSDIAAAAELKESVVKVRLGAMLADGEVMKTSRGLYAYP